MKAATRWKTATGLMAAAMVGFMVHAAIAASVRTTATGGSITQVKVVRSSADYGHTTADNKWETVPGATTSITVPAATKAIIIAGFQAESICSGGFVADECDVRILIGSREALPAPDTSNTGGAFDSVGSGADYREMHYIERDRGPLGPGTYAVKVQERSPSANFTLSNFHLTVFRVKA